MRLENLKAVGIFEDCEGDDVAINDPVGRLMEAPSNTPAFIEQHFKAMHSRERADMLFKTLSHDMPARDENAMSKLDAGADAGDVFAKSYQGGESLLSDEEASALLESCAGFGKAGWTPPKESFRPLARKIAELLFSPQ